MIMNSVVFFAFLVADVTTFMIPGTNIDLPDERLISKSIAKGIVAASQSIKDAGFDPLYINKTHVEKALPVPVLFNCEAFAENISSFGLSNIVIHSIIYSLFASRFNFDFEWPLIDFSVGAASFEAMLFNNSLDAKASGKVEVQRIRIIGEAHVTVNIFSGISIRRLNINFTLGKIISDIKLIFQGKDESDKVNIFIGKTVPATIQANKAEVNKLLEIVLKDFINTKVPTTIL